ncbi:NADPH:quinone reductase-like Zn-dependent oxidoreductase [Aeromicrobium sp. SORGH_AS981]|nr:NADPH:quinone reductase-like Zn-dependent oxidoreductase [Aeromicrobium sp. SORGH_AS_0981]
MRAMTYAQYGDDDVLELTDQPTPKVGPGEILVEVRAASVNPVDWKLMSGGLDAMMDVRFPVVPGWDVAGVVSAVGIDTPEFAVGDEVVAYNRQDYVHRGTFAEYTTVPVRAAARKPRDLSWEEAASLPLAGLTAFQALERLEVGPEDTVLVHGAGGGVGSFAVQLAARAFRARVIGSASASQHDRIRDLGGEPVEYGDGLVDAVRELAPDGVSVVLDLVGGVVEQTVAVLEDDGRHASIADPDVLEHGGLWLWVRPDADDLGRLVGLVDDGTVRVEVDGVYDLEDLADAFARSREGHVHGKLAIRVSNG